jgi:hypothetical protein
MTDEPRDIEAIVTATACLWCGARLAGPIIDALRAERARAERAEERLASIEATIMTARGLAWRSVETGVEDEALAPLRMLLGRP